VCADRAKRNVSAIAEIRFPRLPALGKVV
jgi:hypothetical protein